MIDRAMAVKVAEFLPAGGRSGPVGLRALGAPAWKASADTRMRKSGRCRRSGVTVADRSCRVGWDADSSTAAIEDAGRDVTRIPDRVTVGEVVEAVSAKRSSWGRPDIIQPLCDLHADRVADAGTPLGSTPSNDPPTGSSPAASISTHPTARHARASDGRSVWIEPTAPAASPPRPCWPRRSTSWPGRWTPKPTRRHRRPPSTATGWMCCRPMPRPRSPATTGWCLVVGPAGAGKTRMLAAAVDDLHARAGRVRGGADGESGPCPGTRHRHRGRHRRQAAPRVAPPRPAASTGTGCPPARPSSSTKPACSAPPPSTNSSSSPSGAVAARAGR